MRSCRECAWPCGTSLQVCSQLSLLLPAAGSSQCQVVSLSSPLSFAMPAWTAAAAGCADIRNSLRSAGSSSRPGQRASQANKGRRSATGAAVRPPVPPRLGRTSSQAVGSFTSRRTCACCRRSFETHLAWQRPRRPICSRTIGPRCWQPFKRLSTGTSRWCRPETASPVHVVLVLLASR